MAAGDQDVRREEVEGAQGESESAGVTDEVGVSKTLVKDVKEKKEEEGGHQEAGVN